MTPTIVDSESALCGGVSVHEKGAYNGEIALTGKSENVGGSAVGIWVN